MQAGLRMGASYRLHERKNIPAKIVTVSCECQLRCRFSRLDRLYLFF